MANEYETFVFLEEQSASSISKKVNRKNLRVECDPFSLEDVEFVKRYRLSKVHAYDLCDELRPFISSPVKSTDLSVETKVLAALSFYATGSYQRAVGNIDGHCMAQQTVSSVISEVTKALNTSTMREKYIFFPKSIQDRNNIKVEFYKKNQIPGVLGCIDCTHVAIVRPINNEERYYCRKHYYSLNVQLICDAHMNIISVDASHGGANHDSFIWINHPLNPYLDNIFNTEKNWLLGDSGYPLRRTMMIPVLNALPNSPEAHYTKLHVRARNCIERTIGLLKARFHCLIVHRVLHYSPEVAGLIVNACVILHNICNKTNTPVPQLSDEEVNEEVHSQSDNTRDEPVALPNRNNVGLQQGYATRNALIQQLWERHHTT